jgi:hypothetical protein
VIRQVALYTATADDIQAARLSVAGRPVVFRAILAAARAGASRVGVPVRLRSPALDAALATSPSARAVVRWLDGPDGLGLEPTLLLPAAALMPAAALIRLLELPAGRVLAESLPTGAPTLTLDATRLAAHLPDLADAAPLADVLGRELKAQDFPAVLGGRWFVRVTEPREAAEAEERLWSELGSAIDSRLDMAVHRRLSRPLTRLAVALRIPPNPITVSSGVLGLAAAAAFQNGEAPALLGGLLLYFAAVVLDHTDGEVARLTLTESSVGEWLDIAVDTAVHTALVVALGVAADRVTGGGLAAGAVAAAGVIGSAVVGKLWPPPPPTAGQRGLLDSLTSRDGFYAMLVIFIALRLLQPALLPFLMLVIAVGTHAYWLARAGLSLRPARGGERRS